ncbi:YicC/YloC family endoribonuclease [Rhodovibrio salinarum]|uniref:YicC family protein n=2 Tax=Rhodovibrio salinarum TaxID=1087 RepID=A0A934V0D0_9PROT|nr:YicC family protein [Rhodovibrio salinarum]
MTVASMTGFARREGGDAQQTWVWEAKSVNGKGLDVRVRVPSGMDRLEHEVRSRAPKVCTRGNISVSLSVERTERRMQLQVNREMLDQLVRLTRELRDEVDADPPRLDGLLAVRGVLETVEEPEDDAAQQAREQAMVADLQGLLDELVEARVREGQALHEMAERHLAEIARLTEEARQCAASQPEALRERLRKQVAELIETRTGLSEERLAQEAALLASKADIREELDRLDAHVTAARELLDGGGAIGRRLDFLCQEFNREANTLCSKASDVALTRIGLSLKNTVEQLREQVQNIE